MTARNTLAELAATHGWTMAEESAVAFRRGSISITIEYASNGSVQRAVWLQPSSLDGGAPTMLTLSSKDRGKREKIEGWLSATYLVDVKEILAATRALIAERQAEGFGGYFDPFYVTPETLIEKRENMIDYYVRLACGYAIGKPWSLEQELAVLESVNAALIEGREKFRASNTELSEEALTQAYSATFFLLEQLGGCPEIKRTGGNNFAIEDGAGLRRGSREPMFLLATNTPDGLAIDPRDTIEWIVGLYSSESGELICSHTDKDLEAAYRGAFEIEREDGGMYTVTMKHDQGVIKISTYAESAEKAAQLVCKSEKAPRRSAIDSRRNFADYPPASKRSI